MGEIQRLIRPCSFHRQRIFRVRTNPLDYLNETEVIERCRLPRAFCRLIDLVNEDVERPTRRSHPLPTSKQVLKYCGARVRHLLHVHICDTLKEFFSNFKKSTEKLDHIHYLLNSHFLDKKAIYPLPPKFF